MTVDHVDNVQRPPAEVRYATELAALRAVDEHPRPPGWQLSPRAVRAFILGDETLGTTPKFVGHASLLDRAMVALATQRGVMLIGEPGTAKSLLSELLAAAISGDSTLTIQGGAATTEDQLYSLTLNVIGDETILLDTLDIIVVVPGTAY